MHNLCNLPRLFKSNVSSCQMKENGPKIDNLCEPLEKKKWENRNLKNLP